MSEIPSPNEEEARKMSEEYDAKQGNDSGIPMPKIDFSMFVMSLATAAHTYLGNIPDQSTGVVSTNLELAKQHIDILTMLKDKTKGNLSAEENNLVEQIVYELQMVFVEKSS